MKLFVYVMLSCCHVKVKWESKDNTPFFVRLYMVKELRKPVILKEMNRVEKLGITKKGLVGYSSQHC